MKHTFLVLIVILNILLSGFMLQQQDRIEITRMQVNIWPEYDQPAVLVIYRIQVSTATRLPAQFSIRIPREAGNPYKVAMKDLDGLLYDLEYTLTRDGFWNSIVFTSPSAELQIEYYDPRLLDVGEGRKFTFEWIADYPVENLQVSVQQPRTSYSMTILPEMGPGRLNPDDHLVYFSSDVGRMETDSVYNLDLEYIKLNYDLSAESIPVKMTYPVETKKSMPQLSVRILTPIFENKSLMTAGGLILGGILLFVLVALISGGKGISFFNRKRDKTQLLTEEEGAVETYCSHCGKKAQSGDRYCRVCGSSL